MTIPFLARFLRVLTGKGEDIQRQAGKKLTARSCLEKFNNIDDNSTEDMFRRSK